MAWFERRRAAATAWQASGLTSVHARQVNILSCDCQCDICATVLRILDVPVAC